MTVSLFTERRLKTDKICPVYFLKTCYNSLMVKP